MTNVIPMWDVELECKCGETVYLYPAGKDWPGLSEGGCDKCGRCYIDWWDGTFCVGE